MLLYILILLGGFIALYLGAKLLIRGGTGFATAMRVKPILIGLTVVALGTSLPELTVGVVSASKSVPGLSIGNIIGSNICNILLIFGVMSLIRPLRVSDSSQRGEMPAVLASGALLWIFAADGQINRLDSIVLLVAFCTFLGHLWTSMKTRFSAIGQPITPKRKGIYLLMLPLGLALLIFGGWACVKGGTNIAEFIGVPKYIIGLTIIAIGTSLPELAIGILASIKGQSDIPIGNTLGSNIFNSLGIVGVMGVIQPFSVDAELLSFSLPVMLAASIAFLPLAKSGMKLSRLEGAGFIVGYVVYIVALIV